MRGLHNKYSAAMIRASPLGLGLYRSKTGVLVKLKKIRRWWHSFQAKLVATTAMAVGLPRKQIQEETHTHEKQKKQRWLLEKNTMWNLFVPIFHGMASS